MDGEHSASDATDDNLVNNDNASNSGNTRNLPTNSSHTDARTVHADNVNTSQPSATSNARADHPGGVQARSSTPKKSSTKAISVDIESDVSTIPHDSSNFDLKALSGHPNFQRAMAAASLEFSRHVGVSDATFDQYLAPSDQAGSSMETHPPTSPETTSDSGYLAGTSQSTDNSGFSSRKSRTDSNQQPRFDKQNGPAFHKTNYSEGQDIADRHKRDDEHGRSTSYKFSDVEDNFDRSRKGVRYGARRRDTPGVSQRSVHFCLSDDSSTEEEYDSRSRPRFSDKTSAGEKGHSEFPGRSRYTARHATDESDNFSGKWPGMCDNTERGQGRKTRGNFPRHDTPGPKYSYDNMYDEKSPNVFHISRPVFSENDDSLTYDKYRYNPPGLSPDSTKEEISPFSHRSQYPFIPQPASFPRRR